MYQVILLIEQRRCYDLIYHTRSQAIKQAQNRIKACLDFTSVYSDACNRTY